MILGDGVFEIRYAESGVEENKQPLFYIKKLTVSEKAEMDDNSVVPDEKHEIRFLLGTHNRLKIKYGLVGWKNIEDEKGNSLECNDVNKDKLPPGVVTWLLREIDKLNKVVITGEERKNL